jgi:homoserine O-succinyltransferase
MPLVNHIPLPTFDRLRELGHEVLSLDHALHQDIRELHIGLLNMMPDAALQVTEQQFMRLVGNCNQIAQFFVHPFSIPGLPRSPEAEAYIDNYYTDFGQLQEDGLDALIITGANVSNPTLELEPFWEPLKQVIGWATENVASVLCSCLATHAIVKHLYHIDRQRLARKNAITHEQFEKAGLTILAESPEGDVHMAISEDLFRVIYFQGHPEYYHNSLLKEYKREVKRFVSGEREEYPPHPEHYFSADAAEIADQYEEHVLASPGNGAKLPAFPEDAIDHYLDNTWGDTGKAIVNNWLGLVYQLTDIDRKRPFAPGVDPDDPLGIR